MPVHHPLLGGIVVFEVGTGPTVVTVTSGTSFDELRERLDVPLVRAPF